jgi:hypothetical protein
MTEDSTAPTPEDDSELLGLVDRMLRGEPIDWDAVRRQSPYKREEIDALRAIAAIDAAQRPSVETDEAAVRQDAADSAQWRHLRLLEKIGEGQFGEVYRAFDTTLQIDVALKISRHGMPSGYAAQVVREARLLARIRHPNVVRVHGAEYGGDRAGFWMDLVRGRTLEQILQSQRFSAEEATTIGIALCRALAAVHAGNVLHGDIKAHNVMRSDDGETVLVDFGAGRPLDGEIQPGSDLAGTLLYMAPEVLDGQPRSRASDIYSLGILLFRLVADAFPIFATTIEEARAAHRRGDVKRLHDLRPSLPDGFVNVIERATDPDPARRFPTAGAMQSALASGGLSRESPAARPRRRLAVLAAALSIAAAMLIGAAVTMRLRDSGARTPAPAIGAAEATPATAGAFGIDAAFFRVSGPKVLERLAENSAIRVADQLNLTVRTTAPAYVYVVNEDEAGASYLLFPLPGQRVTNPLPGNTAVTLPGEYNWQVSSAGGREHFLVFASAQRLDAFEDVFRQLPAARAGAYSEELPPPVTARLRGVGGLAPREPEGSALRTLFTTPLTGPETVNGMWVRQLTLVNLGAQ